MTLRNSAALIAGAGMLPVYWAREAAVRGMDIAVISVSDLVEEELKMLAHYNKTGAGRLGEMIGLIKATGIGQAVFLGKVGWDDIFSGRGPDDRMSALLDSLNNSRNTGAFFTLLAREFHREGIMLLDQTLFMDAYLAKDGMLTPGIKIGGSILKDVDYAFDMAKRVSSLGIGQAVVVKNGAVVAVEAAEGTDNAIKRSGSLVAGGIVAKVSAANHDPRFDVPAVGMNTIKEMIGAGSAALVLEAEKTFVFQKDEVVRLALEHNIPILGKRWAIA